MRIVLTAALFALALAGFTAVAGPGARAEGAAVEAVLTTDNLRAAKALFVGNSLRGLIRAKLV